MTDAASCAEAPPLTRGKDWAVPLSLVLLLLAGGLAVAKTLGHGPADLQAGGRISTVYAAVLAYEYAAVPITGSILLAWVLLVASWLRRLRQPLGRRSGFVAVGVSSLALLWAGLSTLPQWFVGYEHLKSVTTETQDVHLGMRTALDGDFFFVVSQCPHRQLRCAAYGVAAVGPEQRTDLSHVRMTTGTTLRDLVIQTGSRTIPFRLPPP